MIPTTTQPVCQADGCKHGASILSKQGDTIRYMKTCARHSYKDINKSAGTR
jgi:hypothetical protein